MPVDWWPVAFTKSLIFLPWDRIRAAAWIWEKFLIFGQKRFARTLASLLLAAQFDRKGLVF